MTRDKKGQENSLKVYKIVAVEQGGSPEFYVLKFLKREAGDTEQVRWNHLDKYTGLIILFNAGGEKVFKKRYDQGVFSGIPETISKEAFTAIKNGSQALGVDCQEIPTYIYKDWYLVSGNTVEYLDTEFVGVEYETVCSPVQGGGGGEGGASGGTGGTAPAGDGNYQDCPDDVDECYWDIEEKLFQAEVPSPDHPIEDIDEHLACFDTGQHAIVSLHADQPDPGTDEPHNGFDVGHSFFTIKQNLGGKTIRRTIGYYPNERMVNPITDPMSSGVLGIDDDENFNVTLDVMVMPDELNGILNIIRNAGGGGGERPII
ncbi:MAG: hypothetical protein FH748_06395 [Balneolaceae bacterium]|nr:hypothetical protein [Balneolaceae bacterium]